MKTTIKNIFSLSVRLQLIGMFITLLIWHLMTTELIMGKDFGGAFSPLNTFRELLALVKSGIIWQQMLPSLKRVGVGLLFAVSIGIPVGILIGYYRKLDTATNTVFQFLRMISPLAWMPIAIIAFGVGDKPIFFLISITAVWPIIINTAHGVSQVNADWIKIATNFGANDGKILKKIIVPAIIPDVLTGLRVAVGISWVILVPLEMLGVSSGLGYYILDTRDRFSYGELMAWIFIIGLIGFVLDFSIRKLKENFIYDYVE